MIGNTIRMVDANVAYTAVHASRGKGRRAEPVAALYEPRPGYPYGKIWHIDVFPELEDQMCSLTVDFGAKSAGYSPDRCDALVYAFTELLVESAPGVVIPKEALEWSRISGPRY